MPLNTSFEHLAGDINAMMAVHKEEVGKIGVAKSDFKKLVAMPLYMEKRVQNPVPVRNQKEFELFTNLVGKEFTSDHGIKFDPQTKITEFEFEKYLNPQLLQRVNSQNPSFVDFVRKQNFYTNTDYEQLQEDKDAFAHSMKILPNLTVEDQRALLHKLHNERAKAEFGEEDNEDLMEYLIEHNPMVDQKMAQISEEENFNMKNRYRHQKKTMNFAEKKRMPIHESKVADLLRNQHIYRSKVREEIYTF